jgi:hypothetical protein
MPLTPWSCGGRAGKNGLVPGIVFPEQLAGIVEVQRAAIPGALGGVQRPDAAAQDARRDRDGPIGGDDLQVHPPARTHRPRTLHEGAAAAQIHDLHAIARPQRGPHRRRADSRTRIDAAFAYHMIHVRRPVSYVNPRAPRRTPAAQGEASTLPRLADASVFVEGSVGTALRVRKGPRRRGDVRRARINTSTVVDDRKIR